MTTIYTQADTNESSDHYAPLGYFDGENCAVRLATTKEEGLPTAGPLSWLNSARLTADVDDDAIHCVVSIDDPRGGICMTIRRKPNGEILIHLPTPGDGMYHVELRELHPGTLVVVDSKGEPRTFPDDLECSECGAELEPDQDGEPQVCVCHAG